MSCLDTHSAKNKCETRRKRYICSNCNAQVSENIRKGNGDHCLDSGRNGKTTHSQNELIINKSECARRSTDLASGDHGKSIKKLRSEHKSKTKFIAESTGTELSKKVGCLQTIYEHKDANYCDSDSDSFALMSCPSLPSIKRRSEVHYSSKTFLRPVICPVSDCGKVIAVDSVLLHFYFDHSKIPRVDFSMQIPEQIHLNPSLVTETGLCLAVLILQEKECKRTESEMTSIRYSDYNPLLLMAARLQSKQSKYATRKKSKTALFISAATQTDDFMLNVSQSRVSYSSLIDITSSSPNDKIISANQEFDKDEMLLVWLCQLDLGRLRYSITLLRDDKKQAHSYIGETIHIRDQQDSATMLERADCLIVQGVAANRLIDDSGNINVLINILA